MILFPKIYIKNITYISKEMLECNNINGIILDVDNTLIDLEKNMLIGAEEWCKDLQNQGIKFCIVSNSNNKKKVEMVAKKLEIPYVYFGIKPLKSGLIKAKNILGIENKNIAVVGDQIFTDVLGANRCKMFSILVEPLEKKDIWITVIKRPLENYILKKYKGEKK